LNYEIQERIVVKELSKIKWTALAQAVDLGYPAARYMITLLTYRNGITPVNPMTRLLDRTTGPW